MPSFGLFDDVLSDTLSEDVPYPSPSPPPPSHLVQKRMKKRPSPVWKTPPTSTRIPTTTPRHTPWVQWQGKVNQWLDPLTSKQFTSYLVSIKECRTLYELDFQNEVKENEQMTNSALRAYEQALEAERQELQRQREEEERKAEEARLAVLREREERERAERLEKERIENMEKERKERMERERMERERVEREQMERKRMEEERTSPGFAVRTYQEHCVLLVENFKKGLVGSVSQDLQRKKMEINRCIGQITNKVSSIQQAAKKLQDILLLNSSFLDFHVARCFTLQAATEIARSIPRAYAFAHVIRLVCHHRPITLQYLYGVFLRKCPYLYPRYAPKLKPKESVENYLERMGGIVALFAACVASSPITPNEPPAPFEFYFAWSWLSQLLNNPPRHETPFFIRIFLTIAGAKGMDVYGRQAHKLLHYLRDVYLPLFPESACAEKERLSMFLESYTKYGRIERVPESTPTRD